LGQLQEIEDTVVALGYQIIAISPDRPEKLKAGPKTEGVKYLLLSDSNVSAAKAFGLAYRVDTNTVKKYIQFGIDLEDASGETHHILPVPAAYVVGTDGIINFEYINPNYKVRIDPELLLKAAEIGLKD